MPVGTKETSRKILRTNCTNCIGGKLTLGGPNVKVDKGCRIDLAGNVYLGQWVHLGGNTRLYTHFHPIKGRKPLLTRLVPLEVTDKRLEDDVWVLDSIVLPQCNLIARGVLVGAGSVVTKPILEQYTIWAGNPAKKIGHR